MDGDDAHDDASNDSEAHEEKDYLTEAAKELRGGRSTRPVVVDRVVLLVGVYGASVSRPHRLWMWSSILTGCNAHF